MLPSQRSVLFAVRLEGSTSVALLAFFRLLGQSKTSVLYRNIGDNRFFLELHNLSARDRACLVGKRGIDRVESQRIVPRLFFEEGKIDSRFEDATRGAGVCVSVWALFQMEDSEGLPGLSYNCWAMGGGQITVFWRSSARKGLRNTGKVNFPAAQEDRTEGTKPAIVRRLWMT